MTGAAYFPANGTEGDDFEAKWCSHCLADKDEDEFGDDIPYACHLLYSARCGDDRPAEWIYRHGIPWCTAYEEDPDNPARCLFTKELGL